MVAIGYLVMHDDTCGKIEIFSRHGYIQDGHLVKLMWVTWLIDNMALPLKRITYLIFTH